MIEFIRTGAGKKRSGLLFYQGANMLCNSIYVMFVSGFYTKLGFVATGVSLALKY